jgi:hypothetical protein
MIKMKHVFILALGIFGPVLQIAAQSSQSGNPGEETQQDLIISRIIREQSRTREGQMILLTDISDDVKSGNTSSDTLVVLEHLGLAGTANIVREDNLVINNFPDIRTKSANLLADMKSPEAKDILIKMLLADHEPWVLSEIIKSLVKIGINDGESTVRTIAHVVRRFDSIMPDNSLAKSALDAFDAFAQKNNGIIDDSAIEVISRIQRGRYSRQVRERAREVFRNIRKYSKVSYD